MTFLSRGLTFSFFTGGLFGLAACVTDRGGRKGETRAADLPPEGSSGRSFYQLNHCQRSADPVPGNRLFYAYECRVSRCEEREGKESCEPMNGIKTEAVFHAGGKGHGGHKIPHWVTFKDENGEETGFRIADQRLHDLMTRLYSGQTEIPWYVRRVLEATPSEIRWGQE